MIRKAKETLPATIRLSDDAIEALLEPLDGLVTLDAVAGTDGGLCAAAASDTLTGAGHAAVEVHAVDTNRGVVLDTKIDVLADTEAEVASLGEVALAELVLLDLEATLENFLGLWNTIQLVLDEAVSVYGIGLEKIRRTLGPRTVTWTAIFSLRRIPKVRTV
jgi:hypothetical protein